MSTHTLEKRIWSTKDTIYIVGGAIAFYIQFVALKTAIHDEITQRMADKQIIEFRLDALEKKTAHQQLPPEPENLFAAIVPGHLSITTRKFKRK